MSASALSSPHAFFVGWDVGGWNCDNNRKSRDALIILDADRNIVGTPWRGNLRTSINDAETSQEWLAKIFALCRADWPPGHARAILAIDTPLGFSNAFLHLATRLAHTGPVGQSDTNPYLFRATEQFLFYHGLKPLSAIKDMIGSQSTKGMHALAKFAPLVTACGVWGDGTQLTAIEAYPSACRNSRRISGLLGRYAVTERVQPAERQWVVQIDHEDKLDALTCASVAWLFANDPSALVPPSEEIPSSEGWIWVPKDGLPATGPRIVRLDP